MTDLRLSQGEAHILAELEARAPMTIAELHRGLAHRRSTLTSILDRLAERGFITRETGTTDRRTFVIDLTRSGRAAARGVHDHLRALEEAILERLSDREVQVFLKAISAVETQAHRLARTRRSPRERRPTNR